MVRKVYIDLSINIELEVDESNKPKVMADIAKNIAKILNNKDIIKSDISINTSDENSMLLDMILKLNDESSGN